MDYVRPFDVDRSFETGARGYRAQIVSHLETALIIGSWIESGGCGPNLHYHLSDQAYYLVRGDIDVQLGEQVHHVTAGSFVYIPAGVAHRNWNDGPEEEFHFELILPAPIPGSPLLHLVETAGEAPGAAQPGYVRRIDFSGFVASERSADITVLPLAENDRAVVDAVRIAPGGERPSAHLHKSDQYYVVLEGTLEIEVALQRHSVRAGTVVLVPAGVPHRHWNESAEPELHLAVRSPGSARGVAVNLEARDLV